MINRCFERVKRIANSRERRKWVIYLIWISLFLAVSLFLFLIYQQKEKQEDKKLYPNSGISINTYNSQIVGDIALLCKIWGFLKYYHPAVSEGKYNWDFELFKMMKRIAKSQSTRKRNEILYEWVKSIGDVETREYIIEDSTKIKMYPDIAWIEDRHSLGNTAQLLTKIKNAARNRDKFDYLDFIENGGTYIKNEEAYAGLTYPDVGYRLLALFRYWNVIEYYYPHKYLIDKDWQEVLVDFIPQFIEAKNAPEYRLVLLKLVAQINDSHAYIVYDEILEEYKGLNIAPVKICFVEGKAIITNILKVNNINSSIALNKGDIILSVNNSIVDSLVIKRLPYTSASNYTTKLRNIAGELLRTNDKKLHIKYERSGHVYSDSIICYPIHSVNAWSSYQQDKPVCQLLPGNITYLCLGSSIGGNIPDNIDSKGIIIDLRCYPNEEKVKGYWDFSQLYPDSTVFVMFTSESPSIPGMFVFSDTTAVGQKNLHYYKGKKILLVNELTQSHAEFMAMKYQCAPNTITVGSATAGADGGVVHLFLPGGIKTTFTGVGVYYPDGRETQRIGIVPDIQVKPTIKGIRAGRDEILEKAIELIN